MINVVIADDNEMVRSGLSQCLVLEPDITVTGMAKDGLEAVGLVLRGHPDVVLMDVSMPVMDGLAATREISRRCPRTRVVMLTMFAQTSVVEEAWAAGAAGYLLKTDGPEEIADAVRAAYGGARPMTLAISGAAPHPG